MMFPKTTAKRNRALLDMARDKPCLLCLCDGEYAICTPGSTVAAHSNDQKHGKGMGRKADDQWTVWLGDYHHRWLDQGKASQEEKQEMFAIAHAMQVVAWQKIAENYSAPEKEQKAAQWALDQLQEQK